MSQLSLAEVATVLGKSVRQVRYLIRTGSLKAKKDGGRWVIDSSDLPLNAAQREALDKRVDAAKAAFEKGIAPAQKAAAGVKRRRYSVTDLDAFTVGLGLHREVAAALGAGDRAAGHLLACLLELATGCHAYHPKEKAAHFTAARKEATAALVLLLVAASAEGAKEGLSDLAERLEQELIPKVSGLLAGQERRLPRR